MKPRGFDSPSSYRVRPDRGGAAGEGVCGGTEGWRGGGDGGGGGEQSLEAHGRAGRGVDGSRVDSRCGVCCVHAARRENEDCEMGEVDTGRGRCERQGERGEE